MLELAYSLHLGKDSNKSKGKNKGTANNALQNFNDLSRSNNHNLRKYTTSGSSGKHYTNDIEILIGSDDLVYDVKLVYKQLFEQAVIDYNKNQPREERRIGDYFQHVSNDDKKDLACEIIIELGDKDYWGDKTINFRKKMTEVFKIQLVKLREYVTNFEIASAIIHYDEKAPHMHIVGVPYKDGYKNGMKRQVSKSLIFTKASLVMLQDKMRVECINDFNRVYEENAILKEKTVGRNYDILVKDMKDYEKFKTNYDKHTEKLSIVNKMSEEVKKDSKKIEQIVADLKPSKINKKNKVISNEDAEIIIKYVEEVKDIAKEVKDVNKINRTIEKFEESYEKIQEEKYDLINQVVEQREEIEELENKLSFKDKVIGKLQAEKNKMKGELKYLRNFWKKIIVRFKDKIWDERVNNIPMEQRNFTNVAEDLKRSGVFDDDEFNAVKDTRLKIKFKEFDEDGNQIDLKDLKKKKNNLENSDL